MVDLCLFLFSYAPQSPFPSPPCPHLCGRFYLGRTPYLVTSDPEILKEITIKQFDNFSDRTVSLYVITVLCVM